MFKMKSTRLSPTQIILFHPFITYILLSNNLKIYVLAEAVLGLDYGLLPCR